MCVFFLFRKLTKQNWPEHIWVVSFSIYIYYILYVDIYIYICIASLCRKQFNYSEPQPTSKTHQNHRRTWSKHFTKKAMHAAASAFRSRLSRSDKQELGGVDEKIIGKMLGKTLKMEGPLIINPIYIYIYVYTLYLWDTLYSWI